MATPTPSAFPQADPADSDPADSNPSPHWVRSAVSAALCFLPMGIVALVYSLRCQRAIDAVRSGGSEREADIDRDSVMEQAAKASRLAYRWSTAAIIVGVGIYLLLITAFLLLGAFT